MDNSKKTGSENKPMTININDFECILTEIFKKELRKNINTILTDKKDAFLLKINDNVSDFIDNNYTFNYRRISLLKESFEKHQKEFLKSYTNLHDDLNDILVIFKDKQDKYLQLSEYKKHCRDSANYAIHTCKGRIIKLTDKKDNIEFLICEKCKFCSLPGDIQLFCNCGANYYSRVLKEDEDGNMMYTTWEKYHCPSLTNEKMKCIKCKELIFYNLAEDVVMCKACGFKVEPTLIKWNCVYCKATFRSRAKFHDDNDLSEFRKEVGNILRTKDIAKPENMSCDCKVNIESSTFYHKRECTGLLYKGIYQNKVVIVCSACRTANYSEYFLWTCPKCYKRFHSAYTNVANLLRTQSKSYTLKESNDKMQKDLEVKANIRKTPKSRDNSPGKSESKKMLSQIVNDRSVDNVEQGVVKPFNKDDINTTPNAPKAAPKFTKFDSGIYLTTINVNEKTEQKPINEIKESLFTKPERNVVLI